MPKIKYILIGCPQCGTEYKVRLEKIESRKQFECLSCGGDVEVTQYLDLVKKTYRFSELVIDIEELAEIDGEILIPRIVKAAAKSYPG